MNATLRYLRQYLRPSPSAAMLIESSYIRDGKPLPAVVYRPRGRVSGKTFIVLHGLTYHGSRHPALARFASALAASGHIVFIPEIIEWTRLEVAPGLTLPTLHASIDALRGVADVDPLRIGIFGFSFGATQAIVCAHDALLADHVKAIVAWGGYADLRRLVRFGLTGEHELDGSQYHVDPDPYGRWMFGGNYLTSIPGYEDMERPAHALMQLAREAGRSGVFAADPFHDALKAELAMKLGARERKVFELFAPVGPHDLVEARGVAHALAETILAQDPLMDPTPFLGRVRIPTLVTHGRDDRLIPYTESIRLQRQMPADIVEGCTITALFAHSGGTEPGLGRVALAREGGRFLAMVNRILTRL